MNYKTICVTLILLFAVIGIATGAPPGTNPNGKPPTKEQLDYTGKLVDENGIVEGYVPTGAKPPTQEENNYDGRVIGEHGIDVNTGSYTAPSSSSSPAMVTSIPVTSVPTPQPTPTPTPTPAQTTEPSPRLKEAMEQKKETSNIDLSTPEPTPTPTPAPPPVLWGTINFSSEPQNATVYADGHKIGYTPLVKDFSPGYVNIRIEKDGYINFTKRQKVEDQDYVNLNVNLSRIEPEEIINTSSNSSQDQLSFSSASIPPSDKGNDTVADTTTTANDSNTTWVYVAVAMSSLVAVGAFIALKGKQEKSMSGYVATQDDTQNDKSNEKKIAERLEEDPEITNKEIADDIGVDVRTVQRIIKKLKEEGKL